MIKMAPTSRVVFFRTKIGWVGIQSSQNVVEKLAFGCATRDEIIARFDLTKLEVVKPNAVEQSWIDEVKNYANGGNYDFSKIPVDLAGKTDFQKTVISECRKIKHGHTVSYGQLASKANSPRAARAVGTVMSKNNFPLIVPCHRVVAASSLGGFSSPRGVEMKIKLLQLEGNKNFC